MISTGLLLSVLALSVLCLYQICTIYHRFGHNPNNDHLQHHPCAQICTLSGIAPFCSRFDPAILPLFRVLIQGGHILARIIPLLEVFRAILRVIGCIFGNLRFF